MEPLSVKLGAFRQRNFDFPKKMGINPCGFLENPLMLGFCSRRFLLDLQS
nr:MAG TPA: zinc finger protein [Caudoviricetes sp.]